jgi:hypothetical protein
MTSAMVVSYTGEQFICTGNGTIVRRFYGSIFFNIMFAVAPSHH